MKGKYHIVVQNNKLRYELDYLQCGNIFRWSKAGNRYRGGLKLRIYVF